MVTQSINGNASEDVDSSPRRKSDIVAHAMTAGEVLSHFQVLDSVGLDEVTVTTLRGAFGTNQLAEAPRTPAWKRFVAQFQALVIWILIAAAILAGLMHDWVDAAVIMAIVVLNAMLGFIQEERASRALAALRAMSSPMAKVMRSGHLRSLPATALVPGDILQLEAGDHIPADARLVVAYKFATQEASLTGESVPVEKIAEEVLEPKSAIGDRRNMVFMGTVVTSGKGTAVVVATGMRTELGHIAGMLSETPNEPTPLQRRLAELGRLLVIVCLVLVLVIFCLQYFRNGHFFETLMAAISLAVAAVPEGLPAVVTIALAIGLHRMARRNALIRNLPSVETLGSVTVICSDKTGTLTRNEMTVREIMVGHRQFHVTGTGYQPRGEFHLVTDERTASQDIEPTLVKEGSDLYQLLAIATLCNNAQLATDRHGANWQIVGDPTEGALVVAALKAGLSRETLGYRIESEIPFDSDRKMMTVVLSQNDRPKLYCKGAPEVILHRCESELRDGQEVPLDDARRQAITRQNEILASRAMRVLAFAYHPEPLQEHGQYQERRLVFSGLVGMIDPPREEVRLAVAECRRAGIRPVMITGDHPVTALAIGRELKLALPDCLAVTGAELDKLTNEELVESVERIAVYARVSAAHKLRVVQAWKERDHVVAMTGDGVNDAPAVKAADIGIAMGITGTDVTKEAADMVLTDDNFASIVGAVREGRCIFDNIKKFIHYLLSCNAGEVILMFVAAVLGVPMPLIAIQILWINLVTDGLPALALAIEPPERDLMERKPRTPREPVISWSQGALILYHGLLIAAASLTGFLWILETHPENLDLARSVTFAVTALSQLAFALVCRSHTYTLPQLGVFSNRWLFAAILGSGLLQFGVLSIPWLQDLFGVVPIPPEIWLWIIVLSLLPSTVIELSKIAYSSLGRADRAPDSIL